VRHENQVGLVRERFFTPRLRFRSYDELNAWLMDKCVAWAKAHPHPERPERTIWEVFEEERPKLIPYRGRFDGFHALPASVSKTCLVRFDNNKYSVSASAVGRPVEIHAYADRVVIRQDGRIVAAAAARRSTIPGIACKFWRASPALCATARRSRIGCCRRRSTACGANSPDPTMATGRWSKLVRGLDPRILAAVLTDGLPAVEAACLQAVSEGVHSADVVINILARQRDPGRAATILVPDALRLRHAPVADCARYDQLRNARQWSEPKSSR
jgi:hypothetical protein